MSIILVGFGTVGQKIFERCEQEKIPVKAIVSPNNSNATHKKLSEVEILEGDVIVDFSHPSAVLEHVGIAGEKNCALVLGTAGWEDISEKVETLVKEKNIKFFTTHNFLDEAHAFWGMVIFSVEKMQNLGKKFSVKVEENRAKNSAKPYSSTALHTAKMVAEKIGTKAVRKNPHPSPLPEGEGENTENLKDIIFLESHQNAENPMGIFVHFESEIVNFSLSYCICNKQKSTEEYAKKAVEVAKGFL